MILDQFGNPLGWEPDLEEQHSVAIAEMSVPELICEAPANIPDVIKMDWFTQQSQGQWPFCHAHMRTGCSEALAWMASGGTVFQYSRKFAAITDMRMDGNDRRATGASIGGSMRGATKYGEVDEAVMPYYAGNEQYSNAIPQVVLDKATRSTVKTLVPNIRSYDDFDRAMVTGLVVAGIGIDWTTGWANLRGLESIDNYPGGSFLGGHALFFGPEWVTRSDGRHYALHNSHLGWGTRMRLLLSPKIIDKICQTSRYGVILASDIDLKDGPVKPRGWDWIDTANFLPSIPQL